MLSEWREVTLGDLGEVNRGRSRHRPRYAEHLYGGPYPFIQTGDIRESGGRVLKHNQTYSEEGLKQSRLWPTGTMCITIAANIAETAILTYPVCFPDSVVGFIADQDKCDVKFIEYTFRNLKRRLQAEATGSVQDNINLGTLSRLYFKVPQLSEQKAIAHILGSLDDKIELNRKMNETLEAMAQAMFKSWFVDFDPVIDNALASGNTIPNALCAKAELRRLNAEKNNSSLIIHNSSLFPSEFIHTEKLGWIPKGWEVSSVGEEYNVTMGQSPPGSTYNNTGDGIPFFQGSTDFGFRYPSNRIYCTDPKRFASKDDTLISVRAPVGDTNMAHSNCCIGRGVAAAKHNSGSRSFTYYSMLQLREHFNKFEAEGTVFGSINQKDFKSLRSYRFNTELVNEYERHAGSLDQKIETCSKNISELSKLRDTLLPKLLSGELRIKDAEKLVEETL